MVCLLATAFVACGVSASVNYTGSVATTDDMGAPKNTYFLGEPVYANVELNYQGAPYDGYVTVSLVRTTDGWVASHYHAWTSNPDLGWNNGSVSGQTLWTGSWFEGDAMVYDVLVEYNSDEIARQPVTVLNLGFRIEPTTLFHYPGQELSIKFVTTHTTNVFYVQIVNATGATMVNWTAQVALDGRWYATWVVPSDFPDGNFGLVARDAATHGVWDSYSFVVQKYGLLTLSDRNTLLPGESARITYKTIEIATLAPYTGVTVNYSATWLNSTGDRIWENATLPGSGGVHTFSAPVDIALYSDIEIEYLANETVGTRSTSSNVYIGINVLNSDIELPESQFVPGDEVTVLVHAFVGSDNLPGAEVDIQVEWNGTVIAGYGAADIVSDATGTVTHRFVLAQDAPYGTYIVNATIAKAGHSQNRMASFIVVFDGELMVDLDKDSYRSGEAVHVTFSALWNNQPILPDQVLYIAVGSAGLITTGTSTDGTASFVIPMTEHYFCFIQALANVQGYQLSTGVSFPVTIADIAVAAENAYYSALERIMFDFEIVTMLSDADLHYVIQNDDGDVVSSGALPFSTTGSIAYDVPQDPSPSYTCKLMLNTSDGAFVEAFATARMAPEYDLVLSIESSPYLSGSYKPGNTLTIAYSIELRDVPPLSLFRLVFFTTWTGSSLTLLTSEIQGSVQIQIPADAPNGGAWVGAELFDGLTGAVLSSYTTTLAVSDNADDWDTTIGDMQNDTDLLRDELAAAQDDIDSANARLDSMQAQLNLALTALNTTLNELATLHENMSSLEDDIDSVDSDISDRPTSGTVTMWFVVVIVLLIVVALALVLMMRRK